MDKLVSSTRETYSLARQKFAEQEVSKGWYKDSFSYLGYIPQDIFCGKNKIGLDAGCGSGSDMLNISQYGARIVGIDLSDALNITKKNVASRKSIYVAQADIYNLPFRDDFFDFVYSLGVLHHLPEPEKGFRALSSKVKRGGFAIVYLYEDFSCRSKPERVLLKAVNSLRVITKRMPKKMLYLLSLVATPLVILTCSIPAFILKKIKLDKFSERIPYRHSLRFDIIASDIYDRFAPPIENRYSRREIEEWFNNAGFSDVNIINYRGWVAWGKKK